MIDKKEKGVLCYTNSRGVFSIKKYSRHKNKQLPEDIARALYDN